MIDTLNMMIGSKLMSGMSPLSIDKYISMDKTGIYVRKGTPYIVGHINNYRVYADDNGIRLSGSIAKLSKGENVSTPTHKDIDNGLQLLSDTLHLDVGMASVLRIDIACTFGMSNPVANYLNLLTSIPGYERASVGDNSLYFYSPNRKLYFYDKRAELYSRGERIPRTWLNIPNLLRYEMRFNWTVGKQIVQDTLKVSCLRERQPMVRLARLWAQGYQHIAKKQDDPFLKVMTPKDAINVMLIDLLRNAPDNYLDNVDERLKQSGNLDKKRRYRMRQQIEGKMRLYNNPLINELDAEIESAKASLGGW
ncbi:MAG: hypothetical protein J6I41_08180 [Bacteroidales bacterium]|nr:hypothetical protein [Bacteroidales bacterium]